MKRILVVDDDEAIREAVTSGLRLYGYNICTAGSAVEALAQLEYQPPDLALLDINMPGIDGLELCSQLREDPRWNYLPIIFLTALSQQQSKLTAYTVGADDYLCKPFDMRELNMRIKAVLRRSTIPVKEEPQKLAVVPLQQASSLQIGTLYLNVHTATLQTERGSVALTPVELSLLRFLMTHANELFSSEQLLQKVWDYPPGTGDPALVRWHIKNLRSKIETSPNQPRYLHTVPHHGYILRT